MVLERVARGVGRREDLDVEALEKRAWTELGRLQALRDRAKPYAADGRFEPYKVSLKYDNPEARMAHDFPIDMQQIETKQLVNETQYTGQPFPQV